jgi:hypothetical protein
MKVQNFAPNAEQNWKNLKPDQRNDWTESLLQPSRFLKHPLILHDMAPVLFLPSQFLNPDQMVRSSAIVLSAPGYFLATIRLNSVTR